MSGCKKNQSETLFKICKLKIFFRKFGISITATVWKPSILGPLSLVEL